MDDLAAVADAVGVEMDLSVMGTGCFVAIAYLARGGGHCRSMLLWNPYLRSAGSIPDIHMAEWDRGSYRDFLWSAARGTMDIPAHETAQIVRRWAELVPESTTAA